MAKLIIALLVTTLLTACVTAPPPVAPAPVDPEALLPLPGAMNEFELTPGDDEVIGELQRVRAHQEDTLSDIARRFNVGYEEIVAANPNVDPWLPGAGTEVVIPSQWVLPEGKRQGIVINLAAMRLFYFPPANKDEPQRVITHPVGIGRIEWKTPQGKTRIVAKAEAPTWVPTAAIRREHEKEGDPLPASVPPGPDNPMGSHVLRLGWPEYAIHGTNKPASIGMRGTHGCLRMYPEDITALYNKVPVNTPVTVVNEPYLAGFRNETLYLQSYPVLEDDKRDHTPRVKKLIKHARAEHKNKTGKKDLLVINDTLLQQMSNQPRALTLPVSVAESSFEKLLAQTTSPVKNRVPLAATWDGEGDVTMTQLVVPTKTADTDAKSDANSNGKETAPTAVANANALMASEAPAAGKTQEAEQAPQTAEPPAPTEAPAEPAPIFKSGVVSDI